MANFSLSGLTDRDIDLIHQATATILEETGIRVESHEAVELYHSHGAGVEKDTTGFRVRIPAQLMEDCVRQYRAC